jgi:hypothetical protein
MGLITILGARGNAPRRKQVRQNVVGPHIQLFWGQGYRDTVCRYGGASHRIDSLGE